VDKSVHKERFRSFLSRRAVIRYLIAYFVGIESRHVDTTIYGMDDFPCTRRIQLVTEGAAHKFTLAANYVAHDQRKAVIHIAIGFYISSGAPRRPGFKPPRQGLASRRPWERPQGARLGLSADKRYPNRLTSKAPLLGRSRSIEYCTMPSVA
jgi:hypothetical protein